MSADTFPTTTVLYVDDDLDNLESFKAVFRREYRVHLARSAEEAINILETTTIHVLITDQRMPEMSGSDLLEALADKYPDMLRYILTGFSDFDPLVRALNEGKLQGYFSKPLDPDAIRHRIEEGMTLHYLRKENEKLYASLRESEQRVREQLTELEQVYNAVPVGLILVDRDLRVLRINEKLAEIDGLSVLDHLGKTLDEIVPDLMDQLRPIYQPVLDTGEPRLNVAIHGTTIAQPGVPRDWLGSYFPFRNNQGEITGVVGGVIEITELKEAEKKAHDAHLFSENLLQTTNAMVLVMDKDGTVKRINPKVEDLTGYSAQELIGHNWFELLVPRVIYPGVWEDFNSLMKLGIPMSFDNPIITKHGEERVISWSNSIMEESGIDTTDILSVGIDITERKQAEEDKNRLSKQLLQAQKMESIGNLAGGIAHDFNNILSVIIGYSELALIKSAAEPNSNHELQEILAAGHRAKELVTQILTIARKTDEEIKPIRIDTIAKEVLKFIRSSIPVTIDIQRSITSNSLIMANATQIHQVIMNLCTNAAQAMEDTGGILTVEVEDLTIDTSSPLSQEGLPPGKYVQVRVADTGVGISPHILDSIFEPYFTTKEPGEGTGIGLALVHSIVESYKGRIFVESKLGEGTTFTIYLPISKQQRPSRDEYVPEEMPAGNEKILIIDDEEAIAKMYSETLERLGYHTTITTSSLEALELFGAAPDDYDLVITDLTMPKLTGDRLAVEVLETKPDIGIILCSGYGMKIPKERVAELGISALAVKPFVKGELAKLVRQVLDEKNSKS